MRLGTVTLSATLSAALLSGCSFIGGQSSSYGNPYAKSQSGQYGQQAISQNCQIATPRQPIPRGCRPEQVTIGTAGPAQYSQGAYGAQGGFPQQPQFGQPQYTSGGYGNAVGQTAALAQHTSGPKKRKPKLRGSLSLGIEKSFGGSLLDFNSPGVANPFSNYNPQDFNNGTVEGSQAAGLVTTTRFTANELGANDIFNPGQVDSVSAPSISFDDVWSTPASVKAGLEYIINDKTTIFGNVGHTYSEGKTLDVASASATLYRETVEQAWTPELDAAGVAIPGSFVENGGPLRNVTFFPNQRIASVAYDFSDQRQIDLELGARRYFNPLVKSNGFKTVTPFVGASVGVSHVNATTFKVANQTQASYGLSFEDGTTAGNFFNVETDGAQTRLAGAQWLPKGELNVGAEWQLTPGFALAAETGVRIQGARDYTEFTNAAGETLDRGDGDTNVSIPLTLRGSVNF